MAQTHASGKITARNQDQDATSPQALTDIQSIPLSATKQLTTKPRPKLRMKQTDTSLPRSGLDTVDETQNQHLKRGCSRSDANTERTEVMDATSCMHQPPTKRSKKIDVTSPVKHRAATLRLRQIPPRSPLPVHINRVVNPGAPDQRRAHCTSAAVTASMRRKEELKLELERMEKEKICMLAEMEASEEEEQQQEEKMAIRDVTDLAEFYPSYPNIRGKPDKDIVMADEDIKRTDCVIAPVDELEGPVKIVSLGQIEMMFFTDRISSRKRKLPGPRGILVWQLTTKK